MTVHPSTPDWPEWAFIRAELSLLEELTSEFRTQTARHLSTVYPMLDAACGSTATLISLAEPHNIRDGYVIARVVYETLVNCCFIVSKGDDAAERAWRHARQKALRDLDRTIAIAGREAMKVRWSGVEQALAEPRNQELLAEFTSRSGREITAWTPENVKERLEAVYERFGEQRTKGMLFGLLLYRHASEIAHGTLYGALFILGATDPKGAPKSIQALHDYRTDHSRMLLMLTGFGIESSIQVLAPEVQAERIAVEAKKAQRLFSDRRRPDV